MKNIIFPCHCGLDLVIATRDLAKPRQSRNLSVARKAGFRLKAGMTSLLFFLIVAASSVFSVQFSLASARSDLQSQLDSAGTKAWGTEADPVNGLPIIIQYVISAFLSLLGIIFLILIIYAGYNWMTAQGDEEKVNKAKDTLTRAIIGLIIILAAYAITYFVFQSLAGMGNSGGGGSGNLNITTD